MLFVVIASNVCIKIGSRISYQRSVLQFFLDKEYTILNIDMCSLISQLIFRENHAFCVLVLKNLPQLTKQPLLTDLLFFCTVKGCYNLLSMIKKTSETTYTDTTDVLKQTIKQFEEFYKLPFEINRTKIDSLNLCVFETYEETGSIIEDVNATQPTISTAFIIERHEMGMAYKGRSNRNGAYHLRKGRA